jgi:hypothetical protein
VSVARCVEQRTPQVGVASDLEEDPQVHQVHRARLDPQVRVVRPVHPGRRPGLLVVRAAAVVLAAARVAAGTLVAARSGVEEW